MSMHCKNRTFKTDCALDAAMSLIEGKWKPMILCKLFVSGGLRFNELLREMPAVSPKILTKQLRELENDGLIARIASDDTPARIMYAVTPRGMTLMPILKDLATWALDNLFPRVITVDGAESSVKNAR